MKKLIETVDLEGIREALSENPALANLGLPVDDQNATLAHPLHRICDGVFNGLYSDAQAAAMAKLFLDHGANIDGFGLVDAKDSPLTAAASLQADEVALLYISKGADIQHRGCHGGTALHWAAWCGRDRVVRRLIEANAEVNRKCIDFQSTPLFWAVHGYTFGGEKNLHHQHACVKLLIEAGAEKNTRNFEGYLVTDLLREDDHSMRDLLK
jgi:uncharacterized protein